mgnify:FL=1|tara:strand:+ start:316 stop:561 length:246 start_codon:yes stop_codon:yes gene_type:complete
MTYYLLLEDDSENDVYFDSNVLGEESFDKFYPENGFRALMNIKDRKPELLEMVTVKKETGEVISLDQFIDIISTLKIQKNA